MILAIDFENIIEIGIALIVWVASAFIERKKKREQAASPPAETPAEPALPLRADVPRAPPPIPAPEIFVPHDEIPTGFVSRCRGEPELSPRTDGARDPTPVGAPELFVPHDEIPTGFVSRFRGEPERRAEVELEAITAESSEVDAPVERVDPVVLETVDEGGADWFDVAHAKAARRQSRHATRAGRKGLRDAMLLSETLRL